MFSAARKFAPLLRTAGQRAGLSARAVGAGALFAGAAGASFAMGPAAPVACEPKTIHSMLEEIVSRLAAIEGTLGIDAHAELWEKVNALKKSNPENRCTKYMNKEFFDTLSAEDQAVFIRCVKTGVDNADSGLGCYAMKPSDYTTFAAFFDQVRSILHTSPCTHTHKQHTRPNVATQNLRSSSSRPRAPRPPYAHDSDKTGG